MNAEETREAARVMMAAADGAEVEIGHRGIPPMWEHTECTQWDWISYRYRIKPTPKHRPWRLDEVPVGEQVKKPTWSHARLQITGVEHHCAVVGDDLIDPKELFNNYVLHPSGDVCGSLGQ